MNKREIFIEALQKEDRAERTAFLDAACGQYAELRKQVEELLAEHEKDDNFFIDSPPPGVEGTIDTPITEKPGTVIGPYKLLQKIGEGGFGVVYMADQKEPVKRRVALKIVKPGMDTQQVIARFEAERQALAMMDHPNIAKVLDAGTTDSGRPYFVMELVKGVPITRFCDEKRLPPRQRLELFVPVCQAIQHAHQKGVIHRDIKPTNVMVGEYDDRAVPRIIDFGVAKATVGLVAAALVLGLVVSTWQAIRATNAEVAANNERDRATSAERQAIVDRDRAVKAQQAAQQERDRAETARRATDEARKEANRYLHVVRMKLAGQACEDANLARASEMLELCRPQPNEPDMREFAWYYLWRHCQPDSMTMKHGGETIDVWKVAWSPDGKLAASAGYDRTVRLWDVETGQSIATFPCDQPNPFAIAFSPDGTLLAVGGGHNDRLIPELKLWNTTTRQLQATLDGHTYLVGSVAFSPDGKTLASGGGDRSIILWDVGSGEIKATITGHEGLVRDLAFTSNGITLASASYDRTVRLWDTATGRELRRLPGHKNQARCVAFSPDNRWLLTGGGDGTVRLWSAAVGEARDTLRGHAALMSEVAFSPDGRQLVSGGKDAVRLWDVETAELRATFSGPEGSCEIVAFSPDGRKVAATGFGGAIRLRTPDPTRSGAPRLLDVSTGREPMPLQAARGCVFSCVRFSPDGATLAAAGRDAGGGTVILWDTETGRQRRTLNGHKALATRVSFSPDGQALASGGGDNTIKLWEPATGQLLNTLKGHTGVIFDVRFSPDGKMLASASLDKTVKLWDVASGEVRITLTGHAGYVCSVAFSPDGKTLASAGYDNKVMLWQVSSGEQLATLTGHDASIWQLVFSPDGKILASVSLDRTTRLWRAATEEEVLLSDCAASIATDTDDQQRRIISDLEKFLAIKGGKGLRLADVSRAVSTARALEEAGNHDLAASAYRELAVTIAGSQDEKLSRMSETWEGIARRLALVGNQIELEGSLVDGAPLDWAAYRGKVVLAVFWPTWCSPTELSLLRNNYRLYRDRGLDVVVFDIGSDRESLEDYLEREQIEWPVVSAGEEKPEGLSAIYGVDQTPTSILIDGQGRVVSLDARGRQLDKLLEQLLGPPVSPALLKSYAGVYTLTPQFALTVKVEDGKLMVQATGQDKYQVFAESKTKFFYRVVEAQISFVPDQDGKINHLLLHQDGLNQKGVRKN